VWTHWHGTDRSSISNNTFSIESMIDSHQMHQVGVKGTSVRTVVPRGTPVAQIIANLIWAAQAM
jgi:hypothetical protein